jgi:hypothetical protein
MARRLAQVARLGRLAWWTLSLPSLLWLGRLGREVAYISESTALDHMPDGGQGLLLVEHRAEIAHVKAAFNGK